MILFKTEKSWELNVVITWKILDSWKLSPAAGWTQKSAYNVEDEAKKKHYVDKGLSSHRDLPLSSMKNLESVTYGNSYFQLWRQKLLDILHQKHFKYLLQVQNLKYISQNCFLRGNFHLKIYSDIKIRNEYKLKWSTLHMWHCLPRMGTAACGLIMQISDHVASRRISQKHRSFQKHRRLG